MNKFNLHSFLKIKLSLKEAALVWRTNAYLTHEVRELKVQIAQLSAK